MAPNATFDLIFLGLGWPWVGEFVGFIIIFHMLCKPTEFGTSQTPYCCNARSGMIRHARRMRQFAQAARSHHRRLTRPLSLSHCFWVAINYTLFLVATTLFLVAIPCFRLLYLVVGRYTLFWSLYLVLVAIPCF